MPVSARAVGTRVTGKPSQITARDCLAYAAGIGDTSPDLFDDEGGAFVAPPQMCVSLEWPVVIDPTISSAWAMQPEEALRGVHLTQDSVFHRPIRPGDRLSCEGRVVGVERARSGTKLSLTLSTRNDGGEAVVTSWWTSLMRSVPIDGEPEFLERAPDWPDPATAARKVHEPVEIAIAFEMPHVYTECARIWNPIHTERAVAHAAGLPEPILHGTATWALAGREIIRRIGGGDPKVLARLSGRFAAMVIPGTSITIYLETTVAKEGETLVFFQVLNPDGKAAVADGRALVRTGSR